MRLRLPKYLKLFGLLTVVLLSIITFIHLFILARPYSQTEHDQPRINWGPKLHIEDTTSLQDHTTITTTQDETTRQDEATQDEFTHQTAHSQLIEPVSLMIDQGDSWPKDSFCDEFISHKFKVDVSFCKDEHRRIECFGSPYIKKMGSCTFNKLAIDLTDVRTITNGRRPSIDDLSMWLVREHEGLNPCPHTDFSGLERHMERGDWVKNIAKKASLSVPKGKCQEWINGTTFFFIGNDVHIYFKFLSWYSLHNGMANNRNNKITIIRLPETLDNQFLFPEFEKQLFPEANVHSIEDFSKNKNGIVCFQKVIAVPGAFASTPFRCKMADAPWNVKSKCYTCNSRGLPGTRIQSFRRRVLNACELKDSLRTDNEIKTIVVQLRKQYHRFVGDNPSKYSRVLKNPDELVTALQERFPSATVQSMHPEDLPLCEQISLTHQADILIGVHGAGLVHLWWLQDNALLFELVPRSQLSNPTFKLLSTLAGKNYYGFSRVGGNDKEVILNMNQVVSELQQSLGKIKL